MITRRQYLKLSLATGFTLAARPSLMWAEEPLIKRAIPSTGELLPAIGLGSWRRSRRSRAARTSRRCVTCWPR